MERIRAGGKWHAELSSSGQAVVHLINISVLVLHGILKKSLLLEGQADSLEMPALLQFMISLEWKLPSLEVFRPVLLGSALLGIQGSEQ